MVVVIRSPNTTVGRYDRPRTPPLDINALRLKYPSPPAMGGGVCRCAVRRSGFPSPLT